MSTGTQLRDQGIADTVTADTAAHRGYGELIHEAVDHMENLPFTADDIRHYIRLVYPGRKPHSQGVVGATIAGLAKQGLIRRWGQPTPSTQPSRHGNPNGQWVRT